LKVLGLKQTMETLLNSIMSIGVPMVTLFTGTAFLKLFCHILSQDCFISLYNNISRTMYKVWFAIHGVQSNGCWHYLSKVKACATYALLLYLKRRFKYVGFFIIQKNTLMSSKWMHSQWAMLWQILESKSMAASHRYFCTLFDY
jgi:hypothetical protein